MAGWRAPGQSWWPSFPLVWASWSTTVCPVPSRYLHRFCPSTDNVTLLTLLTSVDSPERRVPGMMQSWGHLVARRAKTVLGAGLALVVVAAVFGLGVFGSLSNGGFDDPASESARSLVAEHATFASHDADIVIIYSSP